VGRGDAEGDSVQSRQLHHATGESFAFDVPITQTGAAQPGRQRCHRPRRSVDHGAEEPESSAVERTLTITATPSKTQYLPGEKGSFDVLAVDSAGQAGPGRPELWRSG
jgi:hypothetical protein